MADYVSRAGSERSGVARSVFSVGETIEANQVYSSAHPMYKEYTALLQRNLAEIVARESEKQAKAQQAVCTVAMAPESREAVARDYPEFRVVWPQWASPLHAEWISHRQIVNQYMAHHLQRYANSYVHYGTGALSYATLGIGDVTLCVDTSSPVAVHESFDDDMAFARLSGNVAALASGLGWIVDPHMVDNVMKGHAMIKRRSTQRADLVGDALIVDGGLYAMSPDQFAVAMVQHRSQVGMYALPYHSSMLLQPDGELLNTDVRYEIDEQQVLFKYPQGVAGATRYTASMWHQWLLNTIRGVKGLMGESFQYELMGTRGPFMLVRVVRVAMDPPAGQKFVHTLQLREAADTMLVRTWRLRGLTGNVHDPTAWEQVNIIVPARVVEKTFEHAMALEADQFSRFAIRKRMMVTNDRVVVQGTSVTVQDAMRTGELDPLEIAIHSHAFVARYESGRVAAKLRHALDEYAGFAKLGFLGRLSRVMYVSLSLAYDWTLGKIDNAMRSAFDNFRRWVGALPAAKIDTFEPAPQFLRYDTVVRAVGKPMFQAVADAIHRGLSYKDLAPTMPGFDYVVALGGVSETPASDIPLMSSEFEVSRNGTDLYCDIVDTSLRSVPTRAASDLVRQVGALNAMDMPDVVRHEMLVHSQSEGVHAVDMDRDDYSFDPGYITTLNEFHDSLVPGMRTTDFSYDPSSLATDDQARALAADRLVLPMDFGEVPRTMEVFESRLDAYKITKRPMTFHETLSAMHARNLSAPVLALPQHEQELVDAVVGDFLDIACIPGARQMLAQYQTDPVSLEESALVDWVSKAKPETSDKVLKYLLDNPVAYQELEVWRYEAMIKTDVKPPLSDKPLLSRVEPQLIVHHLAVVNAIYSSVFRVLVRRFLSLLKPNYMLNLLKDMHAVRDKIQAHHEWGEDLKYLENDFSKYDKSQGQFVHRLEMHMFGLLGMNQNMLEQWKLGHLDCHINSFATGISLHVRYQRKSGDATTAFGNGMLNIMSVTHAYKGSDVVWAVFIGDDSLVAVRKLLSPELAVQALAEKFNLQAKFFVTTSPYFASNFILFQQENRRVVCVPDPLKRVEKWSMAISAVSPNWQDRYESALDGCRVYRQRANLVGLDRALYERYGSYGGVALDQVGDAVASAIRSFEDFRRMWKDLPTKMAF